MILWPLLGLVGTALILCGILGWDLETRSKKALRFFGLLIAAFALGGMAGASATVQSEPPHVLTDLTISATPQDSFISCDNATHQIVWNIVFNSTSQACAGGSWEAAVQFDIQSNEAVNGEVSVTLLSVSSVGDHPILSRTTNGSFEARWTLGNDWTWGSRSLEVVANGHVNVVLDMLLNPSTVALMHPLDSELVTISVGGMTWTVEILLTGVVS